MARSSGRQPPRGSSRSATPATRSSRYVDAEQSPPPSQRRGESARSSGRSRTGSGKFLAIFLGFVGLLIGVCLVLYVTKSSEESKFQRESGRKKRKEEANEDRVFQAFQKAQFAGKAFVTGQDPNASDDQLFGPFRSDPNVYNVVYTRNYKDKNRDAFIQKMMDKGRSNIGESGASKSKEGVQIKKGKANGTDEIMTARKNFSSDPADKVNQGGEILVVTFAVKDKDLE